MKVRWFHSLTFKLFLLMSLSLLLTVTGIAWQHTSTFRDFLDRQMEDTTVARTREVAKDINAKLNLWVSLISLATQRLGTGQTAEFDVFLTSLLASAPDITAIQVIKGNNAKTVTIQVNPTAKETKNLTRDLQGKNELWLKQLSRKAKNRRLSIGAMSVKDGVEIFSIALRFKVGKDPLPYWTIVSAPLEQLRQTLPNDQMLTGWILDDERRSTLATNIAPGTVPPIEASGLASLRLNRSPFGFKAFQATDGRDMLSAYASLPDYGLSVFLAQDAAGARAAILRTILRTLLWAWLFFLAALMLSFISSNGLTHNLRAVTVATQRIASGDFSTALRPKGRDEVAVLSLAVNSMAHQIQNLLDAKVAAARQEKELETARLVQTTLFPREGFKTPFLSVEARSYPASECGGDWWGHFRVDENREYVFIADATGHGAAAALVTAIAFSTCKTLAITQLERTGEPPAPNAVLQVLNRTLYESGLGTNTMTFFAALIDMRQGRLTFANAGHNMPFIIPSEAEDERMSSKGEADAASRRYNHFKLKARGSPLGYAADSTYETNNIELRAGDKLMLYTDGLFECTDLSGKAWREKGMRRSVTSHASLSAKEFQESVVKDAFSHFGKKMLDDDITVVVVEVAKNWQPSERSGSSQNKHEAA